MPVNQRGATLGMKRDEVERDRLAVCCAFVVLAMLQKAVEERARFCAGRSRARRSANLRIGQRGSHACDSIVVELEVFLRSAVPIADVRLVPHFEVPGAHLPAAVAINKVLSKLAD